MLYVIVSGGEGQLGLSIAERALRYPNLSCLHVGREALDLNKNPDKLRAQLSRLLPSTFDSSFNKLVLINSAAYTAVDMAETDRESAFALNQDAAGKLAQLVAEIPQAGMIQMSTDFVFDGQNHQPYAEDDTTAPLSVYGQSKLGGEYLVRASLPLGRRLIVRTSWLYSPFRKNFVLSMLRLSADRESLGVVMDQVGSPTYAPHLADALLQIALSYEQEGSFREPLLHISDSGLASWYDLAAYALRLYYPDRPYDIRPIGTAEYPTTAVRPAYSVLSTRLLRETYGICPPHWTEGVHKLIDLERASLQKKA